MTIVVETERMVLRRFTGDDAELLFDLLNDAEVMNFIDGGVPVSMEEIVEDRLPAFLAYYQEGPWFGYWAGIEKKTGEFLGWFSLRPGKRSPDPELGYRLHRTNWNRGYASEGSRALIDRGFENPEIERIYAETMAVHSASRRVMEKIGMRFVRSFRFDWPVHIPGDEHGDVEYEITREMWLHQAREDPPLL